MGAADTAFGHAAAPVTGRMGAFASIGLPGVDLLVDRSYAPDLAGSTRQSERQSVVPGSAVELLHADQVDPTLSGAILPGTTRQAIFSSGLATQPIPAT